MRPRPGATQILQRRPDATPRIIWDPVLVRNLQRFQFFQRGKNIRIKIAKKPRHEIKFCYREQHPEWNLRKKRRNSPRVGKEERGGDVVAAKRALAIFVVDKQRTSQSWENI